MDTFVSMVDCLVGVFVQAANFVFGLNVLGINLGALFVIGLIISFAAWLIWG